MARADNGLVKLIVATDLSTNGDVAVAQALDWARRMGCGVTLLHVVSDPLLAPAFSDDVTGDLERARQQLTQMSAAAGVPCRVDVRSAENVAEAIVAASHDADYLLVGAQGKSAIERLRLGSVATAVLRRAQVPVVCCPRPAAT